MKNRYTATIVGTALFFGGMSTALTPTTALAATTKDHFKIIVEDKLVSYEIQPEFVHDRAFVPLRDLSETLGATVDYDASTQVATLKKDDIVLTLNFKTGVVQKNGTVIKMDEAPRFIRDHALVPLRFISQAFGNEVTYDAKTMTASVLPTQKTLAQRVAISGLLYQVAAASQAKNSYELNLHLQQSETDHPNVKIYGDLLMDYTKDPLTLYAKGELKALPANLAKNGPLSAEMYLVDNNWYFKDSQSQKWNYLKLTTKQINNYMQSVADMESHMSANLESLLPYLSLTETADSYTITAKLDNKGLDQLNKFDPSFHGNVSNIDYDYFPIKYKAIIDLSIDKSTYLAKEVMGTYTEHDTFLRSNVTTTLSLYGTIGMYDRIPAIKIPDDVAKAIADDKTKSDN